MNHRTSNSDNYIRPHNNTLANITERLFLSPWWVSMSIAFFCLYFFRAIIPYLIKNQTLFSGIAPPVKDLGTLSFWFFFAISLISAIRELSNAINKKLYSQEDQNKNNEPVNESVHKVDAETDELPNITHTSLAEKEQLDLNITIFDDPSYNLPYTKKSSLITKTERDFLCVLNEAVDGKANIYPQVRLWDILKVSALDRKNKRTHENRIRSKHIDFTLCDKKTFKILGCIELDDKTHNNDQAIKNDMLKDDAFKAAGLPLIRINCEDYTLNSVKDSISIMWQQ